MCVAQFLGRAGSQYPLRQCLLCMKQSVVMLQHNSIRHEEAPWLFVHAWLPVLFCASQAQATDFSPVL